MSESKLNVILASRRFISCDGSTNVNEGSRDDDSNNVKNDISSNSNASVNEAQYDPWKVLDLKPGVSKHILRTRYHELMKEVHPELCSDGIGNLRRLAEINKAYELITRSPTLDRRYRNLITDQQYFYYRYLPEWMAKNVDEMPRYYSWMRWRFSSAFNILILCMVCYFTGVLITKMPIMVSIFVLSLLSDVVLHTMLAPTAAIVFLGYAVVFYRSTNLSWLTSPKDFLKRELSY